jgi:AraC family transcriptional regulator
LHPGISVSEVIYARPQKCPKHAHQRAFFGLLLDGGYAETLGNRKLSHPRFRASFHPAGTTHADEIMAASTRFLIVELSERWIMRFAEYSLTPAPELGVCSPQVSWLALRLYQHYRNQTLSPLMAEGLVLEMLAVLAQRGQTQERRPPSWMPAIEDLLRSGYAQKQTLAAIALQFDLHPAYLSRTFRRFTGESIGEFLHRLRIEYALSQLAGSSLPLCEIALLAGFSDQSQFSRIFKQRTGLTPAAFRANFGCRKKDSDRKVLS